MSGYIMTINTRSNRNINQAVGGSTITRTDSDNNVILLFNVLNPGLAGENAGGRAGHWFFGWVNVETGQVLTNVGGTVVSTDMTIQAQWVSDDIPEASMVEIEFVQGAGHSIINRFRFIPNTPFINAAHPWAALPPAPVHPQGLEFRGWYIVMENAVSVNRAFNPNDQFPPNTTLTVMAVFGF